jgi:hypothetical protein
MRKAVDIWMEFELPSINNDSNYYYIEDGYNFIIRCFKYRILSEPKFKNPENNNYAEY